MKSAKFKAPMESTQWLLDDIKMVMNSDLKIKGIWDYFHRTWHTGKCIKLTLLTNMQGELRHVYEKKGRRR